MTITITFKDNRVVEWRNCLRVELDEKSTYKLELEVVTVDGSIRYYPMCAIRKYSVIKTK